MKTSKKLFGFLMMILFFSFTTASAFALSNGPNERILVKISPADDYAKVNVRLSNLLKLPTRIRIKSATGEVLYRENIKEEYGFAKKFDLSQLPLGQYTITIEQEGIKITQHLTFSTNSIVLGGVETWKFEEGQETGIASKQ